VDQRPLPEIFAPIVIKPNPPHYSVFMPFKGSTGADYLEIAFVLVRFYRVASAIVNVDHCIM